MLRCDVTRSLTGLCKVFIRYRLVHITIITVPGDINETLDLSADV